VALTATPADGWAFTGWTGACTGTGACSVTMNGPESVSASFTELPPTDYVAYYSFNGAGGLTDASGSGHTAQVLDTNNVTPDQDRFGTANDAYHFAGLSERGGINAVAPDISANPTQITLSVWLMPEGSGYDSPRVLAIGLSGQSCQYSAIYLSAGNISYGTSSGYHDSYSGCMTRSANSGWSAFDFLDSWLHLVVTYDGTITDPSVDNLYFYIDGEFAKSQFLAATSYSDYTTYPYPGGGESMMLDVGFSDNHNDEFQGAIDDVRVYNRVLSSAEIVELYNYPY
jgi:hypothetical protein